MREVSIQVSGKTEDEAIQNALAQTGLDRDDVSVEIIERAKPGFLGIGAANAIVKVSYMTNTPEPPQETPTPPRAAAPPASPQKPDDAVSHAQTFLAGLLSRMDIQAEQQLTPQSEGLFIELSGPNMGALIGRRGETLDAVQQLTSYVVNKNADERTRIYLDTENYRKKREETLIRLANKMAEKAIRYRKSMGLEPMNAYERHIIHTALQDVENITTYSAGSEPNRRVFVAYERTANTPEEKPTHREWS